MIPPFALPDHLRVEDLAPLGRTLRVQDLLRGRLVALKWASTRVGAQGLKREWTFLGCLSTRFVPEPVELALLEGHHAFMTVGWIEGEPLDRFLCGSDAAGQVAGVMDALAGLDHLHRAGLCHRDIRADNLLFTPGPSGRRARWLDLEHSVTAGSLESGAVYVGGRPPGTDRGGDVFNPQHDIESFLRLLDEVLRRVPDSPAVGVLKAFADRASSVFYLDEMPHACAAWTILREMLEAAQLPVPSDTSPLGNPRRVSNSNALRRWRSILAEWGAARDARVVFVHGGAGTGKRTFLAQRASELAADGATVTHLLGTQNPDWNFVSSNAPKAEPGSPARDLRRVVLLEADAGAVETAVNRMLEPTTPVLIVVVGDARHVARFRHVCGTRATFVEWRFVGQSARDWYRWIRASA